MALILGDRIKETTTVAGTGTATLLGATTGFQSFAAVGNGNTTYYCIADQGGPNWEVGIGTYTASGTTLARTTVLASSNAGALVVFTTGVKDVFVTYPSEKGVWLDASNNAIGLGTPASFVGTNITGTASGLTAGNVTTNANLTGAVTSTGNATSLGSFTSLQLATALTDETGSGSAVFATSPTLANPTYTGTLTGSTGILNIGSGQLYKDASGNVGIGTSSPSGKTHIYTTAAVGAVNQASSALNIENTPGDPVLILTGAFGGIIASMTSAQAATPMRFFTGNTERMRIDSSGNLLVGTTSALSSSLITGFKINSPCLGLQRGGTDGQIVVFGRASDGTIVGNITTTSSTTAYNTSSDQRLKTNIVDAPSALNSVNSIKVRSFDWKSDGTHVDYGYIAQELLEVAPEAVAVPSNEDEMMGVDFGKLTPRLVKAIQELKAIIDTQQEQINSLLGK